MIPDPIDPGTRSNAEKSVYRLLKGIEGGRWKCALHSVNLVEHMWQRMGEIDFIVLGPRGIFVLEIKGGRVACGNGTWEYTDRGGNTRRKRNSPVAQARDARFSLEGRMRRSLPPGTLDGAVFGHGVLLPDCRFDLSGIEWDPQMLADRSQLSGPDSLNAWLDGLADYFWAKEGAAARRLSEANMAAILQLIRPDFDTVPTLTQVAADTEAELARLTDRQYATLDAHVRNPRMIVEGGAGTGKTLVAIEACRRRIRSGATSVIYTVKSPIVAGFAAAQRDLEGVTVLAFDQLRYRVGLQVDAVIVDEAQDLLTFEDLQVIDDRIKGGLENGSWYLFLDGNNQRGLTGGYEEMAMDYVRSFRPAEYLLTHNCRNTRQIALRTTELTGADVGTSAAGDGPEVVVRKFRSSGDAASAIAEHLRRLLGDGEVPSSDVMLLSSLDFELSSFRHLPEDWRRRIDIVDLHNRRHVAAGRLGFATTAHFKGLESPFVVLADSAAAPVGGERPSLYVGMTRARIGLWVAVTERES